MCAVICGIIVWRGWNNESLRIVFFGFSDADAILVAYGDHSALIDTANKEDTQELIKCLDSQRITRFDLLILTHPDKDHIGGAVDVMKKFEVGAVFVSPFKKGSDSEERLSEYLAAANKRVITPDAPVRIGWGDASVTIYPPGGSPPDLGSNESSLITVVQYRDIRAVLPGDAVGGALAKMLEYPVYPCDLYKLPHHGRDDDISEQALRRLQPRFVVSTSESVGGFVQKAMPAGAKVFYTANGSIIAQSDGRDMHIYYAGE